MSHLMSYSFTDLAPCSVCVEWPYAYVVGGKNNQGSVYTHECRKLQINTYPITVVDSYTYLTSSFGGNLTSVRLQGNYLFLAGNWNLNAGPYWQHRVYKVDKTNLSNIIWTSDNLPQYTTASCSSEDALPNTAGTYVMLCGHNNYGQMYTLDATTGAQIYYKWQASQEPDSFYSLLGYRTVSTTEDRIDVAGTYSNATVRICDFPVPNITGGAFLYGANLMAYIGGESYGDSYYISGIYYVSGYLYQKAVWRIKISDMSVTWGSYIDDLVGVTTWEGNYCTTVDGNGVYSIGYTGSTPPQGTLSKYDLNGNFQWAINFGSNDYPYGYRSISNYGSYIITVEGNGASVGTGWLNVRNKSDGAIAQIISAPLPAYFPA